MSDIWNASRSDLIKRLYDVQTENSQLRAAIGTPEVCAGVVSEIVERERDDAVKKCGELQVDIDTMQKIFENELADAMVVIKLYEMWYVPIETLRDKPPVAVYKAAQAAKEDGNVSRIQNKA